MTLMLLMAAVTLLIMLLSFLSLTQEERAVNREYLQTLGEVSRAEVTRDDGPPIRAAA